MKIYNQCYRTVTYGNLIPGIYYASLVFTMSISLGVFLTHSLHTVGATQVPFVIGKSLSTFEDVISLSCFCQIPSSVGFKRIVLQVLGGVLLHSMDS